MEIKKLPTLPTLMKKKQVAAYARVSSGKDAIWMNTVSALIAGFALNNFSQDCQGLLLHLVSG